MMPLQRQLRQCNVRCDFAAAVENDVAVAFAVCAYVKSCHDGGNCGGGDSSVFDGGGDDDGGDVTSLH